MHKLGVHVLKALKVSLLVGVLLIAINQGDVLWQSFITGTALPGITWLKICMTPCVPFLVSLYSSLTVHPRPAP